MGKNKRAAKAAWRAAAAAATTTLPAATHQRESQPASALAAHLAQSPAPSLVIEPATPIADATAASAVEDTTHTQDRHAPNTCAATREREPPPALTTTTNTPHEPVDVSPSPPAQPTPFAALSTSSTAAIAALAACIHAAGPPAFLVTTPTHTFDDECAELPVASGSTTSPAPATRVHDPPPRLATTREEIHPDLLAAIIEDGRRLQRQAARMQTPEQPSATTWDDGWLEGYGQGCEEGYEQGREEGYKQGHEEGYSEGVEAARAEVSTPHRVDTGVQADHPWTLPQPRPSAHVDTAVQSAAPPRSPVPHANSCVPPHATAASRAPPPASHDQRVPPTTEHSTRHVTVAVVQTDDPVIPARTDSASQTDTPSTSSCASPIPPLHDSPTQRVSTFPAAKLSSHTFTNESSYVHTTSNLSPMSRNDLSLSHNDTTTFISTAHTHSKPFSWADDASSLPVTIPTLPVSSPPRDFSILRSTSARPFESLQRRARRSRPRPIRVTRSQPPPPPQPLPVITRHHPSGLRTGQPSVTIRSSPAPMPIQPCIAPLDWDADPRLCELSRVLQGLGWVRSGSG